jgi:hypothetical protein
MIKMDLELPRMRQAQKEKRAVILAEKAAQDLKEAGWGTELTWEAQLLESNRRHWAWTQEQMDVEYLFPAINARNRHAQVVKIYPPQDLEPVESTAQGPAKTQAQKPVDNDADFGTGLISGICLAIMYAIMFAILAWRFRMM